VCLVLLPLEVAAGNEVHDIQLAVAEQFGQQRLIQRWFYANSLRLHFAT
jgi:hypothetical protein